MILDLNKIKYCFDWWNSDNYSTPREDPYNLIEWFCLEDYEFYKEDYLKKEYGYRIPEEIEESGFYVPIEEFMVDRWALMEKFLEENYPADKALVKQVLDYDCFSPQQARWGEHLTGELLNAAEAWCKKYHIRYKK